MGYNKKSTGNARSAARAILRLAENNGTHSYRFSLKEDDPWSIG
jgi:hypothetical protein